ncbi:MAG: hypothetical protein GX934_03180, partial [Burkholderiales bacterium]|nr:hypothetical protein [Burkholderiales bacterium]
ADPGQPPPPEQQASPAEVANQQEGCAIDDAPADTTDSAVLFVRKVQAHWQDVDARVVQAQAMQVYGRRSKDGFLQFKSEKGTVPVRISDPIPLGPEPDFSLRFAAKAQVNGQEQAAELVVMKDDKGKLHFDSIILIEPQGKVSYGWSETESAWVAGQGTRP